MNKIKPIKEKHGARPFYPPGTMVFIGKSVGIVIQAHVNIDGSCYEWHHQDPKSNTFYYNGERYNLGHSHAWIPTYYVGWMHNHKGHKCAWFKADEWDFVIVNDTAKLFETEWPKLKMEESNNDCANAIKDEQ